MEIENFHIGNYVARVCNERGYVHSDIAAKCGISRQTFHGWLKKPDWKVKDLFTVSVAMGYDLMAEFNLPSDEKKSTKVLLQIEVDESKAQEILKLIDFNKLNVNKKKL